MFNPYSESELRKALRHNEEVFVLMPIEKREIISQDTKRVEDFFKVLGKIGEPMKMRVGLSVSGYDHVSDELFEIPEVHKFVQRLFRRIPHIMYYISRDMGYDEWLLASWADQSSSVRTGDQHGLNVIEVLEKYGTNPPMFEVALAFNDKKFKSMLEGLKKHGKKIGDPVGANAIAEGLDKFFTRRL